MRGHVHSIESLGTVDGPGIRMVVFMQGCPLRCKYCHNPDTWEIGTGKIMEADEILKEYKKNESFYKGGGITVTGGDPLLQIDFLKELFEKAQAQGIHTCLDTSGFAFNRRATSTMQKIDELLKYTDLVLLDIKEIDEERHKALTGISNVNILDFARYLSYLRKPVWVRHVVVPGITDKPEIWYQMGYFLGELVNIKALDILPYHTMGVSKYEQLGLKYPLEGVENAPKSLAQEAAKVIYEGMKARRMELKAKMLEQQNK